MRTKVTAPVASLWLPENVRVTCLDGVCSGGLDSLRPTGGTLANGMCNSQCVIMQVFFFSGNVCAGDSYGAPLKVLQQDLGHLSAFDACHERTLIREDSAWRALLSSQPVAPRVGADFSETWYQANHRIHI